jgi:hypothetical protein
MSERYKAKEKNQPRLRENCVVKGDHVQDERSEDARMQNTHTQRYQPTCLSLASDAGAKVESRR